jgi:hypothetical protein
MDLSASDKIGDQGIQGERVILPERGHLQNMGLEDTPKRLPNLLVQISGSKATPIRVPLVPRFARTSEPTTPTAPGSFQQYLSEQLGREVSAVYYPIRNKDAPGAVKLQAFELDCAVNKPFRYPFVGGMKLLACVDGATEPVEEDMIRGSCHGACSIS